MRQTPYHYHIWYTACILCDKQPYLDTNVYFLQLVQIISRHYYSFEQCHFLDDKAAVFKARNAMQLMPVTGVTMLANYPQESHCAKARPPPPRSPVRPSAVSSRRARAQRVHPWRLPWRPHAYRAALRVSPASKFSERYPSFPPNFTTFGHFLQPTTTWIVLTKPSSALLCKKILAPSKVGLNRKRSDFLDLPNGLQGKV